MYVIETDLGRFEAETEKDAKSALRKAQKQAKLELGEACRKQGQAELAAKAAGYRLMMAELEHGAGYVGGRLGTWVGANGVGGPKCTPKSEPGWMYREDVTIWCAGDYATFELSGYSLVRALMFADGTIGAVLIKDVDRGVLDTCAVGVCEGTVALVPLPDTFAYAAAESEAA